MDSDKQQTEGSSLADQFMPWIDPLSAEKAPVVLVGAGLSYGLVPTADALATDIGNRKSEIEALLNVTSGITPIDADSLYKWAGECLTLMLNSKESLTEAEAKKKLADALGVTSDPRFLAQVSIPLRGTTPRHRVISRLAREGRIESLWSFNWDCWIEAALESVGMRRGDRDSKRMVAPTDWKLRYHVWFKEAQNHRNADTLPLFKAHGCVKALNEGKGDFVVSCEEMERPLCKQPVERINRLRSDTTNRWTVAVGWSATEKYVQELLLEQKAATALGERLTIIDIKTDQPGHLEACESYNCTTATAGVSVNTATPGTTDDLFYWIQTHRGFATLELACDHDPSLKHALSELANTIPDFRGASFNDFWCVPFLDSWLPIWLRTCFMVRAQDHKPAIGSDTEVLRVDLRDAHIPWGAAPSSRNDLLSAGVMLGALAGLPHRALLDFESFPGSFWNRADQTIYLPVPVWASLDDISAVSLKPLLESAHWHGKGKIGTIALLPVDIPHLTIPNEERLQRLERWREALSSAFGHRYLAIASNIKIIELSELASVLAAGKYIHELKH